MLECSLWTLKTSWIRISAISFGRGMKCAILENLSTMMRMIVFPLEGRRPVTKSRDMCDQGQWGTERGCNKPGVAWFEPLHLAQTWDDYTYSLMSWFIVCTGIFPWETRDSWIHWDDMQKGRHKPNDWGMKCRNNKESILRAVRRNIDSLGCVFHLFLYFPKYSSHYVGSR